MKTIIPILFFAVCAFAAPINVRYTIPQLGLTNIPGTIDGIGTKVSQYPTVSVMESNYLFLIAAPSVPTNYNIPFGQLLTNLTASFTNGQAFTNILLSSFVSPTNGVSSATAIDFSVPEATTNITANLAFTSIINWNPTNYNYAIRHIINNSGGNLTLTTGTGWRTDPNLRTSATSYTITNNTVVDLLVGAQINFFTNANVMIASQ